ncbi:uncharacterized protein LY89DRAFT_666855 [Mollisia scopiformis]|uniref:Uncharacterized protein n=1 Tax=Mollisia scopiformis TaxID=149040 RepID=A0A194XJS4_MOLSC|nr:uncharacterized protein LY89DRAFT_666855 [Mollisia scopiformis]KUJ20027.1 hypothetical protein LY89DRAFT_666855 [Mollisia scopiformis]
MVVFRKVSRMQLAKARRAGSLIYWLGDAIRRSNRLLEAAAAAVGAGFLCIRRVEKRQFPDPCAGSRPATLHRLFPDQTRDLFADRASASAVPSPSSTLADHHRMRGEAAYLKTKCDEMKSVVRRWISQMLLKQSGAAPLPGAKSLVVSSTALPRILQDRCIYTPEYAATAFIHLDQSFVHYPLTHDGGGFHSQLIQLELCLSAGGSSSDIKSFVVWLSAAPAPALFLKDLAAIVVVLRACFVPRKALRRVLSSSNARSIVGSASPQQPSKTSLCALCFCCTAPAYSENSIDRFPAAI